MVDIRWLVLLLFFSSFALAVPVAAVESAPALAWNVTLGGSGDDRVLAVNQTNDGGYVIAGYTDSSQSGDVGLNHGGRDAWVVKLNGAGQKVWDVTLGGSMSDDAAAVQQTSDGGYIVAGSTGSIVYPSTGYPPYRVYGDSWVVKLDGAGQPVWNRTLGGSGQESTHALKQTSDGGFVVAGTTSSSNSGDVGLNHGGYDLWVVKLDGTGQPVWNATLGGSGLDEARAIDQTSDGGYIVAGFTTSDQSGDVGLTPGDTDMWVVKLDGAGQKVWNMTPGGSRGEVAHAVQQTSDGGYVVAGMSNSRPGGDIGLNRGIEDYWVVKLDSAGQKVWNTTLGGSGCDIAFAVDQTSDGGYVVAGEVHPSGGDIERNYGGYDLWVVKLDGAGQKVWNKTLGGNGHDGALAVQQASDGGYVVAGYTGSSQSGDVGLNHGSGDFWVVKLGPPTHVVSTVPGDGQMGVGTASDITITYDELIAPGSSFDDIALTAMPGGTAVPINATISQDRLIIHPLERLSGNTSYAVLVPAAAITSAQTGEPYISYSFSFATGLTGNPDLKVYPSVVQGSREVRIQVYGLGFGPGTQVRLSKNGTTVATAGSIVVTSSKMMVSTFDLSAVPIGIYDVVVEWPDHSIATLPSGFEVGPLPGGVLYQEKEFLLTGGQTTTIPLRFEYNPANLFVTLQKLEGSGYDTLTVQRDGVVVETDRNYQDQLIHIPNPPPGNYSVSVTAGSGGHAILTVWDQLPVLTPGEWVVDTIHRSYGSAYRQLELPTGQETLKFEAQAMGGSSHFRIYNGQWGAGQAWISSSWPDASLTIPNPPPGLYIIEFVDSQPITGTTQVRDVMLRASTSTSAEPPLTYLPAISKVMPLTGGNAGTVTLTINGAWLDPNATVSLDQSGNPLVTAQSVLGNLQRTTLSASFDLEGKTPGSYDVTVTNPDGTRISAPIQFVIEEGGRSDFWVELVGRETIRIGRPATYILKYGNRGTLDMPAPLIVLATDPASGAVSIRFTPSPEQFTMTGTATVIANGSAANPDILPAGSSFSREIEVTTGSSGEFTLSANPYGGDPVYSPMALESVTDATAPAPGVPMIFGRVFPGGSSSYIGPFGYGWVNTYDFRLDALADGSIGIRNGNRFAALLQPRSDGTYAAENGASILSRNGDGTSTLAARDGSSIVFGTDRRPISFVDTNGNRVTLTYSGEKLTSIQHSDGDTFTIAYNPRGRISTLTDHEGKVTSYSYNAEGTLLTSVTARDGSITTYAYDQNGGRYGLSGITSPGGITRGFRHDGDGRIVATWLNSNQEAVPLSYDADTRTTTIRDAAGSSVALKTDENGQVIRAESADGSIEQFRYDQNGNLVTVSDPLGQSYALTYDNDHNVVQVQNPLGGTSAFTYDSRFSTVNSVTDPRGNTLGFDYDGSGNLVGITYPDTRSESNVYDAQGNIIRTTTRKGETINYQYTPRGQLSRVDYPDGSFAAYTYDPSGNMLTATNPGGTISFTYSASDLPTAIRYPDGNSFTYAYDAADRLVQRAESNGYTVNYAYDDIGNLVQVTDGTGGPIVTYTYDAAGRVIRKDLRSGAFTTCAYDTAGRVSDLVNYNTTGSVLSRFGYQYDAAGNPVSVDALEGRYEYGYDAVGQLVTVTYPDGRLERYEYDAAGNRISVTSNGGTTAYTTNAMNQYQQVGSATFTYDANGNIVSRTDGNRTTTFEYNYENRLIRASSPEGTQEYSYDALGYRVGVRQNGVLTRYVVDPLGLGNVVAEYAENGNLTARYTHGLGLVSKIDQSGTEYGYHFTLVGHTSEITDPSGRVVNRYQYAPFGEYRQVSVSTPNPFTYVGEAGVMDDGNGLHYMRMRYYMSSIGKFTSEDPLHVVGQNRYNYVKNAPVQDIDPSGLAAIYIRQLDGIPYPIPYYDVMLESRLYHPQIFYDDKTNSGFFKDRGITSDRTEMIDSYFDIPIITGLDDQILREAESIAKKWWITDYDLFGHNCQDYIEQVLDIYERLKRIRPANSVDPEDKYGPTGYDSPDTPRENRQRFVSGANPLEYRVDFWNAENATANVCDVSAFDQLDSDLDPNTFGFTEVGFTDWTVPLGGVPSFDVYVDPRPSMPYIVHITGNMNPATGNVTLEYHTLDPTTLELPDDPIAGFLPPLSTNEYGWFSFSAAPKAGSPSGTVIENRAYVNFDYTQYFPAPPNGPWRNTLDAAAPTTSMTATLRNSTEIHLSLTGADPAGGSGLKDYTIYASDNGGGFTPVLNHITDTSAVFTGVPGHNYRFFSIGRDNVGLVEAMKSHTEATVDVPAPRPLPIAMFSANPTQGQPPLSVAFTDLSENNPDRWSWEFGDGGTSSEQSPTHTYTANGTYTVNLTVTNAVGTDSETKTNYITVTAAPVAPVAAFSGTPLSGIAPLAVQFADESAGAPTAWTWKFGDGGTSTDQHPVHAYAAAGTYTVNLTVTNTGGSDSEVKTDYITVTSAPVAPVAAFTATPNGLAVQFTDTSTGTEPLAHAWTFGDGATSSDRSPTHTYDAAGSYTVTLTVTGANGATDTSSATIEVKAPVVVEKTPAAAVADLKTQVKSFKLPGGVENGFTSKLDAALTALEKGNNKTAVNNLNAFINHAKAQRGKKVTAAQADALIAGAQKVIARIPV